MSKTEIVFSQPCVVYVYFLNEEYFKVVKIDII